MLLTMVLRIICLQGYNLPNPEILVILVQPSSEFLSQDQYVDSFKGSVPEVVENMKKQRMRHKEFIQNHPDVC
ncbi:hypothetical protein E5288_WYG001598 [Bos mutus]|uniref:Uncharacterized protein n=1 Tax=Bos mutus TaxID=72004 RepID=A0A6B0RDB3_9CETA|nr:hypothetical protein [Bos mutus]